jgi:hypothetical protein
MGNKVRRFAGPIALVALAALAWGSIYSVYGDTGPIERWAYFAAGNSGPTKGYGIVPSPMVDVTGKFAGKSHCYTCDWLTGPAVAAFVKPDDPSAERIVDDVERLVRANKKDKMGGCVVFLGGKELAPRLKQLAADKGLTIPLAYLEPRLVPDHLLVNPAKRNTLLMIQDHRAYRTFSNLTSVDEAVSQAMVALVKEPDRRIEVNPLLRYPGTPPRNPGS